MAYSASGLSLLKDLIGGKQREWVYRTTDAITTVDNTDYFASANTDYGMRAGDVVWVIKTDTSNVYFCYVSAVDADGNATVSPANYYGGNGLTVTIAIAASATTDGMDITITVKDEAGNTVAGVHQLEFWMSEDSGGAGLTADTYSGDLTASVGAILSAHTAKKHWSIATAASGIFTATLVASANPADQYVACKNPTGAAVTVSEVSGTNWEGA